jgi:ferredoxin-NADP reductase
VTQKPREYRLSFLRSFSEAPTIKTFVFKTVGAGFSFVAGQYVTVRFSDLTSDPRGNQRQFSISSPATKSREYISVTTTVEPNDSPFKKRLNSLRQDDSVSVLGPFGNFVVHKAADNDKEVVLLAGGIGITPFRSIILTELASDTKMLLRLIYSAKNSESLVFKKEFDELSGKHPNFAAHYTITRPTGADVTQHVGRIDSEYIRSVTNPANSIYYIAGPPTMVDELSEQLAVKLSVQRADIKTERFTGY